MRPVSSTLQPRDLTSDWASDTPPIVCFYGGRTMNLDARIHGEGAYAAQENSSQSSRACTQSG